LQGESPVEEPLDDVIVKISCDAIPIGEDVELPTSATEFFQLRVSFAVTTHDPRSPAVQAQG
jgi:hypothetical protein